MATIISTIEDIVRQIETVLSQVLAGLYPDPCSVEQHLKKLTEELKNTQDLLEDSEHTKENPNYPLWETNSAVLFECVIKLNEKITVACGTFLCLQEENKTLAREIEELNETHRILREKFNQLSAENESESLQLQVGQVVFALEEAIVDKVLAGRTS